MLNVHRNHKAYWGRGEGGDGGGGRRRLYTYRYTVTTRMTFALRWAAMRAILMFHNCEGQSHKTLFTDHNFWREKRAEVDSNRKFFCIPAKPVKKKKSWTHCALLRKGFFFPATINNLTRLKNVWIWSASYLKPRRERDCAWKQHFKKNVK